MSLHFATLLFVATLAVTTHAASFSSRALLQTMCPPAACDAARRTDPGALQTFLNRPNICDCTCNPEGWPLMHVSVESRCHVCIENMIAPPSSCSRYSTDNGGNTAMHTAARLCRLGVAEELEDMGFPDDTPNNDGNTPLCVASRQDNSDCGQIVRQLIANGARRCFVCSDGQTPCGGCVNQGVCDVLRQDGACDCP